MSEAMALFVLGAIFGSLCATLAYVAPALKMMAHFAAAAVLWCALCLWAASGSARH